jgi:uncharacterized membrane protein
MVILFALAFLAFALYIGGWLGYCRHLAQGVLWNLLLGWHNSAVQWNSFLIVAAASVWACLVGTELVGGAPEERRGPQGNLT